LQTSSIDVPFIFMVVSSDGGSVWSNQKVFIRCLAHFASVAPSSFRFSVEDISTTSLTSVRGINFADFDHAITQVRASVSQDEIKQYVKWNSEYGALSA
jgi:hypothetical protein